MNFLSKLSTLSGDKRNAEDHSFVLGHGIDPDTRTIYLMGPVNDEMAFRFLIGFRMLDGGEGDIRIVLNTCGGSEQEGYAIYDALGLAKNNVTIDCYGAVMSIGALILQAGKRRRMSPECRFMFHNGHADLGPGGIYQGTLVAIARESKFMTERYCTIISKRSGCKIAQVKKWCDNEKYFSAVEAVAHGFADEIITPETVELPKPIPRPAPEPDMPELTLEDLLLMVGQPEAPKPRKPKRPKGSQ